MKWNESGFRPPLCTYMLNWTRRTSWGWWDDWDYTVLQTQDSKFAPWRSEAEHATSRSRSLPTILTFTRGWGRNIFVSFKPPRPWTEPRTLAWKAAVLTTTRPCPADTYTCFVSSEIWYVSFGSLPILFVFPRILLFYSKILFVKFCGVGPIYTANIIAKVYQRGWFSPRLCLLCANLHGASNLELCDMQFDTDHRYQIIKHQTFFIETLLFCIAIHSLRMNFTPLDLRDPQLKVAEILWNLSHNE